MEESGGDNSCMMAREEAGGRLGREGGGGGKEKRKCRPLFHWNTQCLASDGGAQQDLKSDQLLSHELLSLRN